MDIYDFEAKKLRVSLLFTIMVVTFLKFAGTF